MGTGTQTRLMPGHIIVAICAACLVMLAVVVLPQSAQADSYVEKTPAANAAQEQLEDASIARSNPFPDLLSDNKITTDLQGQNNRLYTYAYSITRNGHTYNLGGAPQFLFQPGDEVRFGMVMNTTDYHDIATLLGFVGYRYSEEKGVDGVIRPKEWGDKVTPVYLKPKVYLNGVEWQRYTDGGMWRSDPADSSGLSLKKEWIWPTVENYQYIEYRFTIPEGVSFIKKVMVTHSRNHSGGLNAIGLYLIWQGDRQAQAEFTPVDDFAYRRAAGIPVVAGAHSDGGFALPERSAGKPRYDATPFSPLNLAQIGGSRYEVSAPANINSGLAYPYFRDAAKPLAFSDTNYFQYMKADEQDPRWALSEDQAKVRPTYDDVVGQEIPGYVYIANDIDTAKPESRLGTIVPGSPSEYDNSRLTLAFSRTGPIASQERLPQDRPAYAEDLAGIYDTKKHYYLTYRPVPAPVHVTKTDENGRALGGAKFSLAAEIDGTYVTVIDDLVSDADTGDVMTSSLSSSEDIRAFVRTNNPCDDEHRVYCVGDGDYLLAPGKYRLIETDAPEGYTTHAPIDFTVSAQTENIVPVDITVVNEPVTTPPPETDEPPTPTTPPTPGEPPSPQEPPTPNTPPQTSTPPLALTGANAAGPVAATVLLIAGLMTVGMRARQRRTQSRR
ncbi:hypothetical protein H8R18_01465 [Nanchangia anserum]|uniref:SpaA-like prealbumin fold domain-containing protein n=1 Tax=Nanchangia anserum TaxID=2692125 RepID=A0A8I0G931_9ACTO|nr:prealbumin-like fold domain-containing protein [Nanchangia anserum]MBD3690152.1 hypothetical protein [Nanchangia anserum]QOX82069.1 hypothetical protein H8R18_01465 [Nanchangia anserum]